MILKAIICVVFVSYATCRTAKNFREMPNAAGRLSQAEPPGSYNFPNVNGPGTYAFGYEVDDPYTGNVQFRDEEKLSNGTVRGSYGYLAPDNTLRITRYTADQYGYRATTETKRRDHTGPLKLELQLQPSVPLRPYPINGQQFNGQQNSGQQNSGQPSFGPQTFGQQSLGQQQNLISNPSTTSFPDPFETVKPNIDPALAAQIYQQHQINLNPTYSPFRDANVLDPQIANAILQQQFYSQQPVYGFRQNSDGSVSTYQSQSSSQQNRPPWFNWFGANNNNNNNNYQSDQPQQGPVISFLNNLAQNNPITNFLNGFQPQNDQPQNPFQNFLSNINPLNLFSNNNNRPANQQTISVPIPSLQADYVSTMSPSNSYLSSNLDSSVFSNDHFLPPNQGGNFNPGYANQGFNPNSNNPLQLSVNYNPGVTSPTPIYNPNYAPLNNPGFGNSYQVSSTVGPLYPQNVRPYSQFSAQPQTGYPIYQNPYQVISPVTIQPHLNYHPKKTHKTSKKKNNKNKVDVPETDSDWFQGFLDKRKEANLDVSSRRPAKKSSDEDDDTDLDDYFR